MLSLRARIQAARPSEAMKVVVGDGASGLVTAWRALREEGRVRVLRRADPRSTCRRRSARDRGCGERLDRTGVAKVRG